MKNNASRLLSAALLTATAFLCPAVSNAQSGSPSGEKVLGVAGGYVSQNKSGSASVFFQYTVKPLLRIAPEITCVFPNHSYSAFIADVDLQMPVRVARGVNFYPLAGVGFNVWKDTLLYTPPAGTVSAPDNTHTKFGINLGGGLDFYMTPSLKLNLQAKYTVIKDFGSTYISLGVGYVF